MQPIVNGLTGVQSPADGGHGAAVLSSPPQLSPQPHSPLASVSSITSVSCDTTYANDHHLGSTRVTHMSNGAFMTRTLHMAPTSNHGRSHGRRHATLGPYPHSHLRMGLSCGGVGVETNSAGNGTGLQPGKHLVRLLQGRWLVPSLSCLYSFKSKVSLMNLE